MNSLIAMALAPTGFVASLARPLLTLVAFGFALPKRPRRKTSRLLWRRSQGR